MDPSANMRYADEAFCRSDAPDHFVRVGSHNALVEGTPWLLVLQADLDVSWPWQHR